MTPEEAIEIIRANWPPENYSMLREALELVIDRIAELESQIIQQTGISASRMEERERLQKQIAALREIAIEEVAIRIAYENNMCLVECRGYARRQARRQLAAEHPEAFG